MEECAGSTGMSGGVGGGRGGGAKGTDREMELMREIEVLKEEVRSSSERSLLLANQVRRSLAVVLVGAVVVG